MIKQPEFLMEVVKRDGGSLEFLAPLMKPEVRQQLELAQKHAEAIDKFFAEMVKHVADDIEAHQQKPDTKLGRSLQESLDDGEPRV